MIGFGLTVQRGPWQETSRDKRRIKNSYNPYGNGTTSLGLGGTLHAGHGSYKVVVGPITVQDGGMTKPSPAASQEFTKPSTIMREEKIQRSVMMKQEEGKKGTLVDRELHLKLVGATPLGIQAKERGGLESYIDYATREEEYKEYRDRQIQNQLTAARNTMAFNLRMASEAQRRNSGDMDVDPSSDEEEEDTFSDAIDYDMQSPTGSYQSGYKSDALSDRIAERRLVMQQQDQIDARDSRQEILNKEYLAERQRLRGTPEQQVVQLSQQTGPNNVSETKIVQRSNSVEDRVIDYDLVPRERDIRKGDVLVNQKPKPKGETPINATNFTTVVTPEDEFLKKAAKDLKIKKMNKGVSKKGPRAVKGTAEAIDKVLAKKDKVIFKASAEPVTLSSLFGDIKGSMSSNKRLKLNNGSKLSVADSDFFNETTEWVKSIQNKYRTKTLSPKDLQYGRKLVRKGKSLGVDVKALVKLLANSSSLLRFDVPDFKHKKIAGKKMIGMDAPRKLK